MSNPKKEQNNRNNLMVIWAFLGTILVCAIAMVLFMISYKP
ncbi:UNVERIFIED_CONTAM: hypothetical protein ABID98_001436 [Brevibacillus sp. OAP136]